MNRAFGPMLLMLLATVGCATSEYEVTFLGIGDGLADFKVANRTSADLMAVNFELTYVAENGSVVLVDTVEYTAKTREGTAGVFLKAEEQTRIVQQVPDRTTSARGRVIGVR